MKHLVFDATDEPLSVQLVHQLRATGREVTAEQARALLDQGSVYR